MFQLEIRQKKKTTRCVTAAFIMDTEEGSACFQLSGVSPFHQKAVVQRRVWISPGNALISEGTAQPTWGVSSLHDTSCLLTEEPTFSDSHGNHFHSRYARMNSGHHTMSSVLSALMARSDCLLCSDTPSNEKQGAVIQRWNKIDARRLWSAATSANVLWNSVSMETSYRHHRPLTSSFIIQTNEGLSVTMRPMWYCSLLRRPNVTRSGSSMIGDTHTGGGKEVSQRSCTLTC